MTTLLVTSPGGHLRQMWTLHRRFDFTDDLIWATSCTAQSKSLLDGRQVIDLPFTPSRDFRGAMRLGYIATAVLAQYGISRVVSTGALPAVPFFLAARRKGIPCHYIESAARYEGPSLSGRIVSRVPGVDLYCQYPKWADARWKFQGSVLDGFEPGEPKDVPAQLRVVVTMGVEQFGFRRALEKVIEVLPPDAQVVWQTGHTDTTGLAIDARPFYPAVELEAAMASADVVIAHSGAGSALTAMSAGKFPVLLPRRAEYREHVDNHQRQIAAELERRKVAMGVDVASLTLGHLYQAACLSVRQIEPQPFALEAVGRSCA